MTASPAPPAYASATRVVVFDGLCHVCTGWARFLQRHPARPPFRLIAMQSDAGRSLMTEHGFDPDDPLTFLVLDAGRCLTQSDATIHLMASPGGAWRMILAVRLLPRSLRDGVYRVVARNRYRWFGRRSSCFIPEPHAQPESHADGGGTGAAPPATSGVNSKRPS